jgi:RNA polymerase sigma factor (sigma-70 family)
MLVFLGKAAQTFDPDRGVKFTTWAYHTVMSSIISMMREQDAKKRKFWNNTVPLEDKWVQDSAAQEPISLMNQQELKETFEVILKDLDPRLQKIVSMKYGFGGEVYSTAQIATEFGISKTRVDQLLAAVATTLKSHNILKDFAED